VRAFANGNDYFMNRSGLEMRKNPEQEGLNDARRTLKRPLIAGGGKNDRHPDCNRQPILNHKPQLQHGAMKKQFIQ